MFEIGGSLREARLKRNLTPADVQKAIRIRDRYLQALEEERWELLPGDAYVKGFLRTYADYLGLDGNLYVDEYNNRFADSDEPLFVPERLARSGPSFRGGRRPLRLLLTVGAIVAVAAGVAAWQLSGGHNPKQGSSPPTGQTTTGSKPPSKKKQHKTHTSASLPTRATLVASRGNSWLWIRSGSATGATVYEGTLLRGKSLPVNLKNGPVWIRIGNPPNLDIRLGGKLVPGLPRQVGNILLTRHGIRPA